MAISQLGSEGRQSLLIRCLGPVDVVIDGCVERLGSRFARKLLAALAVSANHAVSTDQLSLILWGDAPPATRNNTLQTYVARLRHCLGDEKILFEDESYTLHVDRTQLDAIVFDDLVAKAFSERNDPASSRATCMDALSLWRGDPFGSLADEDPFRLEVIRLEESRVCVTELKYECELALGHEELVVGALEALVAEYPYRERIWQLLMAALARCGRRVEALRAFDQLRDLMADVGLEPTEEIWTLGRQIGAHDDSGRTRPPARH